MTGTLIVALMGSSAAVNPPATVRAGGEHPSQGPQRLMVRSALIFCQRHRFAHRTVTVRGYYLVDPVAKGASVGAIFDRKVRPLTRPPTTWPPPGGLTVVFPPFRAGTGNTWARVEGALICSTKSPSLTALSFRRLHS